MTDYKCLDCGNEMEYEGGLFWNAALTKCFWKLKCPNCGSTFCHRLTKEEEDESTRRALKEKEKEIVSPTSLFTPKITMLAMLAGVIWFSVLCVISEYTTGRGAVWVLPIILCIVGLVFMLIKNRKRGANKN